MDGFGPGNEVYHITGCLNIKEYCISQYLYNGLYEHPKLYTKEVKCNGYKVRILN